MVCVHVCWANCCSCCVGPEVGIPVEEVRAILDGMDAEKSELTLEYSPLYQVLLRWLDEEGMKGREWIDTTTLFEEMKGSMVDEKEKFPYANSRTFSRQLKNLKTDMTDWVEVEGPEKRPDGNNKSFWRINPGKKHALGMEEEVAEEDKSILGD